MVRTKGDNSARRAVAAKAPRKSLGNSSAGSSSSGGSSSSKSGYSSGGGGNPLRVCPTPSWQKGIAEFYPKITKAKNGNSKKDGSSSSSEPASSSSSTNNQNDVEMRNAEDEMARQANRTEGEIQGLSSSSELTDVPKDKDAMEPCSSTSNGPESGTNEKYDQKQKPGSSRSSDNTQTIADSCDSNAASNLEQKPGPSGSSEQDDVSNGKCITQSDEEACSSSSGISKPTNDPVTSHDDQEPCSSTSR